MGWEILLIAVGIVGFGYWLEDSITEIKGRLKSVENLLKQIHVKTQSFDDE
jgi:hypothetical protein